MVGSWRRRYPDTRTAPASSDAGRSSGVSSAFAPRSATIDRSPVSTTTSIVPVGGVGIDRQGGIHAALASASRSSRPARSAPTPPCTRASAPSHAAQTAAFAEVPAGCSRRGRARRRRARAPASHVDVEHDVADASRSTAAAYPAPRGSAHAPNAPQNGSRPGCSRALGPSRRRSTCPSEGSVTSPTTAASIPSRAQRRDVAVRAVGDDRRDQGALARSTMYGSIPTWSQTARTSGGTGIASRSIRIPTFGGHRHLEQAAQHPALGRVVHRRHAAVAQPEPRRDPCLRHHRHLLEERVGGLARRRRPPPRAAGRGTSPRTAPSPRSPRPSSRRPRSPGRAIVGCHERVRAPERHARGAADHRPCAAVVARRVAGDDRDAQVAARARERVPERRSGPGR